MLKHSHLKIYIEVFFIIFSDSEAVVETLIKLGGNLNAEDDFKRTPIYYAISCGGKDHFSKTSYNFFF